MERGRTIGECIIKAKDLTRNKLYNRALENGKKNFFSGKADWTEGPSKDEILYMAERFESYGRTASARILRDSVA